MSDRETPLLVWLRIVLILGVAAIAVAGELWVAPRALEIHQYAVSYAEGHRRAGWTEEEATEFTRRSLIVNLGPIVLLAVVPLVFGWVAWPRDPAARGRRDRGEPVDRRRHP